MVAGAGGTPVTGTGGVGSGGQGVTTGGTGGGSPFAHEVASGCSCQSGPDGALVWWPAGGVLALAALWLRRRPRIVETPLTDRFAKWAVRRLARPSRSRRA